MVATPERELVIPTDEDARRIKEMQEFLQDHAAQDTTLVGADGKTVGIPEPIFTVLRRVVPLMAAGAAIGLVPVHQELTTQQAADLLNISRPSLIKLLDAGEIGYHKLEGGHRRVCFADVLAYKERRSAARRAALAEMAAIGQRYGAYDADADDGLFDVDTDEADDERAQGASSR